LVPSLLTSEQVETRARDFATETLGKTVIRSQDRAGFVVNSLLVPYILAAIRMLDSGFASAEDIDSGMVLGCAHPMGPLALADLIGLDTIKAIAEAMYDEFKEPLYSPAPFLLRMVDAGLLGKKSGRGFLRLPLAASGAIGDFDGDWRLVSRQSSYKSPIVCVDGQALRAASIAARTCGSSGSVRGRKRASTEPSAPTRNFSKFHWTSPVWPSGSGVRLELGEDRIAVVAVHVDLVRHREGHAVGGRAELGDLLGRSRLLPPNWLHGKPRTGEGVAAESFCRASSLRTAA